MRSQRSRCSIDSRHARWRISFIYSRHRSAARRFNHHRKFESQKNEDFAIYLSDTSAKVTVTRNNQPNFRCPDTTPTWKPCLADATAAWPLHSKESPSFRGIRDAIIAFVSNKVGVPNAYFSIPPSITAKPLKPRGESLEVPKGGRSYEHAGFHHLVAVSLRLKLICCGGSKHSLCFELGRIKKKEKSSKSFRRATFLRVAANGWTHSKSSFGPDISRERVGLSLHEPGTPEHWASLTQTRLPKVHGGLGIE